LISIGYSYAALGLSWFDWKVERLGFREERGIAVGKEDLTTVPVAAAHAADLKGDLGVALAPLAGQIGFFHLNVPYAA
jgi:hypothetical protein